MTRFRCFLAILIAAMLALWGALSASLGAWWVRRRASLELAARDAEIKRQQAILNASADAAALKALQEKTNKANQEAANVNASNVVSVINRVTRS